MQDVRVAGILFPEEKTTFGEEVKELLMQIYGLFDGVGTSETVIDVVRHFYNVSSFWEFQSVIHGIPFNGYVGSKGTMLIHRTSHESFDSL